MLQKYLDFLYNLGEFNIKLGLSTIKEMLNRLGNPHIHPRIIHIAGTNGKGSTLTALEGLLIKSGFTTGTTVSPHLVSYNERFRINGEPIDDDRLVRLFGTVCDKCGIPPDLSRRSSLDGKIKPTFFEFSIAIAFQLFKEANVDFIILETGMGGRLDATNIVENPIACAITRIDIDHQEFLGETIIDITNEKLGIIKPNSPLFIAAQDKDPLRHMLRVCEERKIRHFYFPEHFNFHRNDNGENAIQLDFELDVNRHVNKKIHYSALGLAGEHQHENTSTAVALYHAVVEPEKWLSEVEIEDALAKIYWPARLEYIDESKSILIDGAHNRSGVKSLLLYLEKEHANQKILFALGWMKGKNFIDTLRSINSDNITFIPMQGRSQRSETGESVVNKLVSEGYRALPFTRADALPRAVAEGDLPDHDLLVISGSFYLIGEFLEGWREINRK